MTVTPDIALTQSTVWACVRIGAETLGSLPLVLYERDGTSRRPAEGHPLMELLHGEPNPEMSSMTFRETLQAHLMLRGNAYAEIVRNGRGEVVELWPLDPDRMSVARIDGRKVYAFRPADGSQDIGFEADEILHIPGLGYDGMVGYSVVTMMRQALGTVIALEKQAGKVFANAARPGGILKHPGRMSPEGQARLKSQWDAMHKGTENVGKTAVLEEGMEWQQMSFSPEDAEFLQTRQFHVTDICRWFRMPPHMVQDLSRATFSNIEQQSIDFGRYTVRPWCVRWEQEINRKLIGQRSRGKYFAEFVMEGLLRGDSAARSQFYREMWNIGAMSQNEIRQLENLNRVDGGDEYFVQVNMTPARLAADPAKAAALGADMPGTSAVEAQSKGEGADSGAEAEDNRALPAQTEARSVNPDVFAPLWADAARRVLRRETEKIKRALNRPETFAAWLDEFYEEHRGYVADQFEPVCAAMRAAGVAEDTHTGEKLARCWTSRSLSSVRSILDDDTNEPITDLLADVMKWWEERTKMMELDHEYTTS